MLEAKNVCVRYGTLEAVKNVSFTLSEGQWLMLVGPNGSGKSSLLSAVSRVIPHTGEILLDGTSTASMKPMQLARKIAVLSQHNPTELDHTVEEIVSLGRYAYRDSFFRSADTDGKKHIESAMQLTGTAEYRNRRLCELSGGEAQRAFLAQALAQDPQLLLLDEPANHLDLPYQQQLFELLDTWRKHPGRAILSVVHDLSLARCYGTHALLMDKGCCVAKGAIEQVLVPSTLEGVYHMDVHAWMRRIHKQWNA